MAFLGLGVASACSTSGTVVSGGMAGKDGGDDVAELDGADARSGPDADATSVDSPVDTNTPLTDVVEDTTPQRPDAGILHPCTLPGSVQFTSSGTVTVPGGSPNWPSLAFLHLPVGFCAHYFGTVGNARQLRFAPGGELFVMSPTRGTTGGGPGGLAAMVLMPDDDLDGVGDGVLTFFGSMPGAQGLLFANGYLYFQNGQTSTIIDRVPYAPGDRSPSGSVEQLADLSGYVSSLHWPKTLDMADDGTIYVGVGGDQGETCDPNRPFHGGIMKIDPAPGGAHPNGQQVAKGFRNPINIRCARGHNACFAVELALDYSATDHGREKLVPIRQGDDWGFPCCATTNEAYNGVPSGTSCAAIASDTDSLTIGETPFGIDFEPGFWPAPFTGNAFVVTHGAAGGWNGARMVTIPMNPTSGMLQPASDITGTEVGMVDFATGWDDGTLKHGRPAAVTFSRDGRLFVANDNDGTIFWIAPTTF